MENRYLFRAKCNDNGEWVEGLLTIMFGKLHIINPDDKNTAYLIDDSTICQRTGLKDKNGKLIWENDICDRKEKYPEIVTFNEGDWQLDYSYVFGKEMHSDACNLGFYVCERECVEVIGNIFDNPELLEK